MANQFSNIMAANPTDDYNGSFRANSRQAHARKRQATPKLVLASAVITETAVLRTFKSGDNINKILLSTGSATPTTGTIDLGLYKAAFDHVPVAANLIDVDLFEDGLVVTTEIDQADAFTGNAIEDWQRDLALWELADFGGGTYAEDPMEDWDLVVTFAAALDAAQTLLFEIDYVAFG